VVTEPRWSPNLKHLLPVPYKQTLRIPDLEYMILVAAEVKKLGPLTDVCVFTTFINLARASSPQEASFSISRE